MTARAGTAALAASAVCVLATALACGQGTKPDEALSAAIVADLRATLDRVEKRRLPAALRRHAERVQAWKALRTLYRRRGDRPAWSDGGNVAPAADRLLGALDGLTAEGLDERLYPRQELATLLADVRAGASGGSDHPPGGRAVAAASAGGAGSPGDAASGGAGSRDGAAATLERRAANLADLDAGMTYTFLVAAGHLSLGRLQPSEKARLGWHAPDPRVDLVAALERGLGVGGDVAAALAGLAPPAEGYARLRRALASYRDRAAKGGWPAIPPGPPLRPGDSGPRVAALAARLAASGDLAAGSGPAGAHPVSSPPAGSGPAGSHPAGAPPAATPRFDAALGQALSRFQARHGLDLSATVDAATLAALEVPIERRIRQVELNMERWRWMARDPGRRYVLVNLPEFRLSVVENGVAVLTMRVIVGKEHRATPVFSGTLTQIVLNPAWHIPDSIAANEIAPQLLRDPSYLSRKGLAIKRRDGAGGGVDPAALDAAAIDQLGKPGSSWRLVQPPGRDNALGRYKFVVDDRFDVYLHDTPTGSLFARSERDFSHGCIRLEKPVELADLLLAGDPKWTPAAVAGEVESGRTVTIPLARPLPVHIVYQTAWVDRDGTLELRPDVYKHDAALEEALAAETPLGDDLAALRRR